MLAYKQGGVRLQWTALQTGWSYVTGDKLTNRAVTGGELTNRVGGRRREWDGFSRDKRSETFKNDWKRIEGFACVLYFVKHVLIACIK